MLQYGVRHLSSLLVGEMIIDPNPHPHTHNTVSTWYFIVINCIYCISLNKRAGRRGRKWALNHIRFQCNWDTSTRSAENLIQIGWVVFEIWPGKIKSRGAHLFKQTHLFGKKRYSWRKGGGTFPSHDLTENMMTNSTTLNFSFSSQIIPYSSR